MIGVGYVQHMALYNRWQNENLYGTADQLTDEERRRERGAFFGSIQKTLSHLMWADRLWMSRFYGAQPPPARIPESASLYPDWERLKSQRVDFDAEIMRWAEGLSPNWLAAELTYFSQNSARDISGPVWRVRVAFLQPPNPSSRTSPLPADAGWREAAGHRPDDDAQLECLERDHPRSSRCRRPIR